MYATYKDILNNIEKDGFEATAMAVFKYQYAHNTIYHKWCNSLGKANPTNVLEIPFLPVSFFKSHTIFTSSLHKDVVFESSGTTNTSINSKHYIKDITLYTDACRHGFVNKFGPLDKYCILGLLPSYLERGNSSLVYMVQYLIQQSKHTESGFYLNEFEKLVALLLKLNKEGQNVWLIGVTYALLDFFEQYPLPLKNTIILETGGMKGRKKEMIRPEVHNIIKKNTGLQYINGEYGMTELLSHGYLNNEGFFEPISTMKVLVRNETDPLSISNQGKGLLNIIDLANVHSCAFIAVDDFGTVMPNGTFEVNGRVDNSDIRGCSLMYG